MIRAFLQLLPMVNHQPHPSLSSLMTTNNQESEEEDFSTKKRVFISEQGVEAYEEISEEVHITTKTNCSMSKDQDMNSTDEDEFSKEVHNTRGFENAINTMTMIKRRDANEKEVIRYVRRKSLAEKGAEKKLKEGTDPAMTARVEAMETEEEERIRKVRKKAEETYHFAAKLGIKGNLPEEEMIQIFVNLQNERR